MNLCVQSLLKRGLAHGEAVGAILQITSSQEEVEMDDLSPPDHQGPPSDGRASRQSR